MARERGVLPLTKPLFVTTLPSKTNTTSNIGVLLTKLVSR